MHVFVNYDCTTHPILPFNTLLQSFVRKTFLQTQRNLSNFNFHSHSHGELHDFSGEVQKISGEVQNDLRGGAHLQNDLRGGAHLASKSGHEGNRLKDLQ